MENPSYIALSRQSALRRQLDVVANNIANMNTTGFKQQRMMFTEFLERPGMHEQVSFVQDRAVVRDLTAGGMLHTGNPLDVTLSGEGFLSIQTPSGTRYSKNGSLQIDSKGTLVDLAGNPVLGTSGPITFDSADTDIAINKDGTISTSQGTKGKLAVVEFTDPQVLAREGNNYYSGPAGTPAVNTQVVQGSIERSNVSGVSAMADMIRVERAYQTLANIMQRQDELRTTAVQKLGDMTA